MKKFLSLSLIFILNFCAVTLSYSQDVPLSYKQPELEQFIELSKLYRSNPNPLEEDEQRRQAVLNQACDLLPNYGTHSKPLDLITCFIKAIFQVEDSPFILKEVLPHSDRQKDLVFLLQDQHGNLQYVVKAFLYPRTLQCRFLREVSALDFLRTTRFTHLVPVHPLAVALGTAADIEYGLLLETAATGHTLEYLVSQYSLNNGSSSENIHFKLLKKAFHRVGMGLADLHRIKSTQPGKTPVDEIQHFKRKKNQIFKDDFLCSTLMKHFDLKDLKHHLKYIIRQIKNKPIHYTFSHRDSNLGNLVYDENLDKVYLIDVCYLHNSISLAGEPLADGLHDLMRVEESFTKKREFPNGKRDKLIKILHSAYQEWSGEDVDTDLFTFHKELKKMGVLIHYSTSRDLLEGDDRKQAEDLFEIAIDYIKSQIEIRQQNRREGH